MNELHDGRRWIILNDPVDIGQVNATRDNICTEKDRC